MSRIGRLPVELKENVKAELKGSELTVEGPKGSLTRSIPEQLAVEVGDDAIVVKPKGENGNVKALWGLTRSLIYNMVQGVTEGYEKNLEVKGVGYRVNLQGSKLVLNLGYSNPVEFEAPEGINFEVDEDNKIKVSGTDKELVGHTAAQIRKARPPEPYKGKGIRYEDEIVRRKAGKAAKVGA